MKTEQKKTESQKVIPFRNKTEDNSGSDRTQATEREPLPFVPPWPSAAFDELTPPKRPENPDSEGDDDAHQAG